MKYNFKNQYQNNYTCDLCRLSLDNQEHLMKYKVLQHQKHKNQIWRYLTMWKKINPVSKLLKIICNGREALLKLAEDGKSLWYHSCLGGITIVPF